jgi:hypothetical protein
MGIDLTIHLLSFQIQGAESHAHRLRPIATRAAAIFAERLVDYCRETSCSHSREVSGVNGSPVGVDLGAMTDEEAAGRIAGAWLDRVALELM